jgi:chaperonin GroEL|tara:strand:- start:10848 stop:12467 length:1620 start_codon:yes stop_codon:yes gene_type:complete
MAKNLDFNQAARSKMKGGVDKLAEAVKVTLGPRGRNVVIEREYGLPISTKDGVTVAKEIELEDVVENIGAQMVKEVADKANEEAGDGTTTATVLAQSIVSEGFKYVTSGANPIELKRGIDEAASYIVKQLDVMSKDVDDEADMKHVASISANNDESIGSIIADAIDKVGKEGVVTVDESMSSETILDVVEGMQFDRGFLSPYFVTNNTAMEVELDEPWILCYNKRIGSLSEIVKVLEAAIAQNKPLLIIADDVASEALAGLIVNKVRGTMSVAAVKAPSFGDEKTSILQDIAIITGGTLVDPAKGMKLDKVDTSVFGSCKKVRINDKQTTIIDGYGDEKQIVARIEDIKSQLDTAQSAYDREKIQTRLAKLAGGVAVLKIGAQSEVELKEKKDRVEDALHATRAAVKEGVVPGGGIALLNAISNIEKPSLQKDQAIGWDILVDSCKSPFNAIMENAGLNADVIWNKVATSTLDNAGYDARNEEVVDMYAAGIIDPTKVTKTALMKAASVAGTLLTTECVVSIIKEDNKEVHGPGQMPMM